MLVTRLSLLFICFITALATPVTFRGRVLPSVNNFFKYYDQNLLSAATKSDVKLSRVLGGAKNGYVLLFLTHLGDLASFELAQQAIYYLPQIQSSEVKLAAICPGASLASADEFCRLTNFPAESLFIDSTAHLYEELMFSKGFLPENKQVSPYLKLLPMLMGIGSPGTIPEVLRGYIGDRNAPSAWIRESLRLVEQRQFDVLGQNYQRPFELATIRLQNMMDVLQNWQKLSPIDTRLLTQLGGAYILAVDGEVQFEHRDTGILNYVDLRKALKAIDINLVD